MREGERDERHGRRNHWATSPPQETAQGLPATAGDHSEREGRQGVHPPGFLPGDKQEQRPQRGRRQHGEGDAAFAALPLEGHGAPGDQIQAQDVEDEPVGVADIFPADPAEHIIACRVMDGNERLGDDVQRHRDVEMHQDLQEAPGEESLPVALFLPEGFPDPETGIEQEHGHDQLPEMVLDRHVDGIRPAVREREVAPCMREQDQEREDALDHGRAVRREIILAVPGEADSPEADHKQYQKQEGHLSNPSPARIS